HQAGRPGPGGQAQSGRVLARHAAAARDRRRAARRPAGADVRRAIQRDGPGGHRLDARLPAVPGRAGPRRAGLQPSDERAAGHRGPPGRGRPRPGDRRRRRGRADRRRLGRPGDGAHPGARRGDDRAGPGRGRGRGHGSRRHHGLRPYIRTGGETALRELGAVRRTFSPPGVFGRGIHGTHQGRGRVPGGGHAMTTLAPYRSELRTGRDGFAQLLRAEWTKFRTVRGWVIGTIVATLVIVGLGALAGANSECGIQLGPNSPSLACPAPPTGPGGEWVTDSFYFVRQPLDGNGSITVRVTSLTGLYSTHGATAAGGGSPTAGMTPGVQEWSKAGIIIKASTRQGAAYAAMMVTGSHGVRMQWDFTHDVAGMAGKV